ncbi:MAG TPA: acyl carrier protein [Anaerolineae bacterium]
MTTDITTNLAQYIASKILQQPKKAIAADAPLISSGLIDSFHLVDLSLYVEEQFGVRIDDSELNKETFDTLAQLTQLIQDRQS